MWARAGTPSWGLLAFRWPGKTVPTAASTKALLGLAGAIALLVAAPAASVVLRAQDHVSFPDPTGDGDPDITHVTVGSNAQGGITFVVRLANRRQLGADQYIVALIDSDLNTETGAPPSGIDYAIQLERRGALLLRWGGSEFVDAESQTVYGYVFDGFRMAVNKSDLALTTGTLRFWIETQAGERGDDAPDGAIADYPLSGQPLQLRISAFAATPAVKTGKRFVVLMKARRSDLEENTSAGIVRCSARAGGRVVKTTPAFPEDTAACIGTAPKWAKGKTIKVTITLRLDGVTASRVGSIRVR